MLLLVISTVKDNPMSQKSVLSGRVLTSNVVGPFAELKGENVIDRSAGIQRVGVPVVADEAVLPPQDQHGSVDQFQSEQLILT